VDSLKLFTPAQYDALPGMAFPAPADTYPTKDPVVDYLQAYARLVVVMNTYASTDMRNSFDLNPTVIPGGRVAAR
jgi:putative flavoprotein involved in K+ transport